MHASLSKIKAKLHERIQQLAISARVEKSPSWHLPASVEIKMTPTLKDIKLYSWPNEPPKSDMTKTRPHTTSSIVAQFVGKSTVTGESEFL